MPDSGLEEITLAELLDRAADHRLVDLHVAMPARVLSYDATAQTVSVEPQLYRALPDGAGNYVAEPLPALADVPVRFPRCRQFAITFPLVKGDGGLLVFCERSIGKWRATGTAGDPGDLGMHTLDGAVFLPGLDDDAHPVASADAANMVIGSDTNGTSRIEVKPTGGGNLGAGASKGIARSGDPVKIDSPGALATWLSQVETFINTAAPGTVTPLSPTFLATPGAEIKSASTSWKAVD